MFKDKVVIVTGGANGIGRCIADEFRKQGAVVYVIDKQEGEHFDYIDYSSLLSELIGNASANTIGATCHYNYFIFEHKHLILLYHQHYPPFGLNECVGIATNHGINLIGCNGLPILTDM